MKKEEIKQITDYIDENFILDDSYVEKSYKECGNFYRLFIFKEMPNSELILDIRDRIKSNFDFTYTYGFFVIQDTSGQWGLYLTDRLLMKELQKFHRRYINKYTEIVIDEDSIVARVKDNGFILDSIK